MHEAAGPPAIPPPQPSELEPDAAPASVSPPSPLSTSASPSGPPPPSTLASSTPEAIAPPALPDAPNIADGVERQLHPRVVPLNQTIGWIAAMILAGGSLVLLFIVWAANRFSLPVLVVFAPLWLIVNGALAWLFHRWPAIAYRHTFYRVDERGIEIRRGVYWRVVVNVPRSRVQHTDVAQGPLERRFGLGTLVVYTAGTDHARVDLDGLEHSTALRIREHLLPGGAGDAV